MPHRETSTRSPSVTQLTWARYAIPLGSGRGGSGATSVDLLRVHLRTDDGATGTGYTYALTGGGSTAAEALSDLVAPATSDSPLDHWPETSTRITASASRIGKIATAALGAVDIAVWDLRARAANQPLYRYLGAYCDSVAIYGSGRSTHAMTTDELISGSQAYLDEGYDAVKLRVGARRAEEDVERVSAVRNALGPGVRLMIDANERLDLPTAQWMSRQFEDLGVFWLEEPLPAADLPGYSVLAGSSRVPIAAGEHLHTLSEFSAYLTAGAATVLQPDAPLCGGVTGWRKISAVAQAHSVTLAPHFLPELHIHLALSAPNCSYVEHFPLLDDVLLETIEVKDGRAVAPDRPGHGLLWNEDRLDEYRVV
jgi:L-alanine-DL-glutamate epimerase-like enolase superfamily enzyme